MSVPSTAQLRNARRFLEVGSLDSPASREVGTSPLMERAPGNPASSIPHRGGNRDCTGIPAAEWTLDCVLPQRQRSLADSSKSDETPGCSAQSAAGVGKCDPSAPHGAQASNRSCDSYSKIQGALLEATNHEFEGKKLTLRITDVRLIGVSPPPDKDYCLVEVGTNVGLQLEMKYHIEENGHIQAELVLNTSSSVRP
jgi:hypothetical protein